MPDNSYTYALAIIANFPRAQKVDAGVRENTDVYHTVFKIPLDGIDNTAAEHLVTAALCLAHPDSWAKIENDDLVVGIPGKHETIPKAIKPALDNLRKLIILGLESVNDNTYVLTKDYSHAHGLHHIDLTILAAELIADHQDNRQMPTPYGESRLNTAYQLPKGIVAIDPKTKRRRALVESGTLKEVQRRELGQGPFCHPASQLEHSVILNKASVDALLASLDAPQGMAAGTAAGRC